MYVISRDGRKICDFLQGLQNAIQQTVTDRYAIDTMMVKYLQAPIVGVLKTRYKAIKTKLEKHTSFEYWIPMLNNFIAKTPTMIKSNFAPIDISYGDDALVSYNHITEHYLLTDYSYEDMILILKIVNTYSVQDVIKACDIGKLNKVYEPRYINAVLEKEQAKKQVAIDKINQIESQIQSSDNNILNENIHKHTPLDLLFAVNSWNEMQQNMELESKFKDISRNWGDRH